MCVCHSVRSHASLASDEAYGHPHPFLISAWSIAGCCDAVRGEPCQSGGTVTFQRTGITPLTLLLWLEFIPGSPGDDLTLFMLHQDAGGCLKLLCSSRPSLSLFRRPLKHQEKTYLFIFQGFFSFSSPTFYYFPLARLHAVFKLLLHPDVYWTYNSQSRSHCHLKIIYHTICSFSYGVSHLFYLVFLEKHTCTEWG